ncbi:glycosyltransferase 87 family protein [Allokutzneria sp. NRRL B-24872]|uniref:glycosyltransferase 87 family protein n=1 Tax=Allokutzneria sp. NRRL B-24872 TaxID=1137961 RepID=UPI000A3CEB09|nr:glycosyltransferase 87 family protein [Allokutzneria sp. NRRL B-24872]
MSTGTGLQQQRALSAWITPRIAWSAFGAAVLLHALTFLIWPKAAPVGVDLNVYRAAGETVLAGRPLYEGPITFQMEWTYTPFAALVFVPFGVVPVIPLAAVVTPAHLLLVIPAVLLSWRTLGYRRDRALVLTSVLMAGAALWLDPVWLTTALGQVNLVLMMLVLLDVGRLRDSRWQGVLIGVAAGIKLTPLIFVGYLVLTGRWRAAATAVASFAGTIGLGFLLLPHDSARYWGGVFLSSNRIGTTASYSNQSISGMLARLTGDGNATSTAWLVLALVVGVLGMGLAVWAHRRGEELVAVTVVGMTGTAVSPFSWEHHWVWFVPLLVYLVHVARTAGRPGWWVVGGVYALTFAWIVSFPPVGGKTQPEIGLFALRSWPWLEAVTSNVYLLVFALSSAWIVSRLRKTPAAQPS